MFGEIESNLILSLGTIFLIVQRFLGQFEKVRERASRHAREENIFVRISSCHKAMTWLQSFVVSDEHIHSQSNFSEGRLDGARTQNHS